MQIVPFKRNKVHDNTIRKFDFDVDRRKNLQKFKGAHSRILFHVRLLRSLVDPEHKYDCNSIKNSIFISEEVDLLNSLELMNKFNRHHLVLNDIL